jgi:hypothetical protein
MKVKQYKQNFKKLFLPLLPLIIAGLILSIISALIVMHPANGTTVQKTFLSALFDALQVIIPLSIIAVILISILAFSKLNTDFYFIIVPVVTVITTLIWELYLAVSSTYFNLSNFTIEPFIMLILSIVSIGIYAGLKKMF